MKFSKTSRLAIVIGVFVIVLAGLGVAGFQQFRQQRQLTGEISLAEEEMDSIQMEQLLSDKDDLEGQLDQLTAQSDAVKAIFSQPITSIAASSILFDIAGSYGLDVTDMTSNNQTSESLEGITCSTLSLVASVEGDVPDLVSFIIHLNSHLPTDVIRSLTITIPEIASGEKASADIQLIIYTYQES